MTETDFVIFVGITGVILGFALLWFMTQFAGDDSETVKPTEVPQLSEDDAEEASVAKLVFGWGAFAWLVGIIGGGVFFGLVGALLGALIASVAGALGVSAYMLLSERWAARKVALAVETSEEEESEVLVCQTERS